ncbi:MAG TPA: hypothetical protein VHM88_11085, partial [Candidatus Acidoferrales bacterium]|nr:hypothetical protein [Candidatus Acidoferrales bacterium]
RGDFGHDPRVVGGTLRLNDEVYTIVGVMPPGFVFPPNERAALYTPLARDANRNHGWLWVAGRLKPGIGLPEAQAEMATISLELARRYPKSNQGVGVNVVRLQEAMVGNLRPAFLEILKYRTWCK